MRSRDFFLDDVLHIAKSMAVTGEKMTVKNDVLCLFPTRKKQVKSQQSNPGRVLLGGVYMTTIRMNTETFVFVYIEAMRCLHQYVFVKDRARYCNY